MNYLFNKSKLLIFKIIFFNLHAAEFNPESYDFSKKSTIEEWVHPYFNPYIDEIQKIISNSMMGNVTAITTNNIIHLIKNNDKDNRFYGKSFPIIALPLKLLLTAISDLRKQLQSPEEKLILLEVGGSSGLVPLLMTFAGGPNAIIIYNELSKYEVEAGKEFFKDVAQKIPTLPIKNIIFDIGNANDLPERLPQYINRVTIAHVQNVEHFMNPPEHTIFVGRILKLVGPRGFAHLLAHTIPDGCGVKGNPFFDAYIKNKKNDKTYPMFLKTENDIIQLGGQYIKKTMFIEDENTTKIIVSYPEENDICTSTGFVKERIYKNYNGQPTECFILHQENLLNYFTPTIYRIAYTKAASQINTPIEQTLAGFIDNTGETLYDTFDNTKNLTYALSIFYKPE